MVLVQISRSKNCKYYQASKTASTGFALYFLAAFYFHISVRIFCNLFICLVFDGLLQSICLGVFCSKHSITFDTYLLSCRFRVVDIFYIDFRPCETFAIQIPVQCCYWLKYCLTLELWNVDLSYTCKCVIFFV